MAIVSYHCFGRIVPLLFDLGYRGPELSSMNELHITIQTSIRKPRRRKLNLANVAYKHSMSMSLFGCFGSLKLLTKILSMLGHFHWIMKLMAVLETVAYMADKLIHFQLTKGKTN